VFWPKSHAELAQNATHFGPKRISELQKLYKHVNNKEHPSTIYANTKPKWNTAIQHMQWNNIIRWQQYGW
jgi:hypothetical protein